MGEVTVSYIDPRQFDKERELKNKGRIEWIHSNMLTELSDEELISFILNTKFVKVDYVSKLAIDASRNAMVRKSNFNDWHRGVIVRALKCNPLEGMTGNDFVAFFKETIQEKERQRIERMKLIREI